MQIWKLNNNKWRHNKTMAKFGLTNYISFERYWWELSKNVLFIEFIQLCQKLWAFLSNFGLFRMSARQISSCQVTQEANFENVLFYPNSTFNVRKSHKISSGKALYFRSYQAKPHGGGDTEDPQYLRVKTTWSQMWLCTAKTRQLAQPTCLFDNTDLGKRMHRTSFANSLNTQYKITGRKIEVGVVWCG